MVEKVYMAVRVPRHSPLPFGASVIDANRTRDIMVKVLQREMQPEGVTYRWEQSKKDTVILYAQGWRKLRA